jgi:hypothetical protein
MGGSVSETDNGDGPTRPIARQFTGFHYPYGQNIQPISGSPSKRLPKHYARRFSMMNLRHAR